MFLHLLLISVNMVIVQNIITVSAEVFHSRCRILYLHLTPAINYQLIRLLHFHILPNSHGISQHRRCRLGNYPTSVISNLVSFNRHNVWTSIASSDSYFKSNWSFYHSGCGVDLSPHLLLMLCMN